MNHVKTLIFALMLLLPSVSGARNIYMLSIGVSNYPGTVNDLILAAQDATDMYRLYKQNSNADAVLLTNRLASKARILSEAKTMFRKAGQDDIVILFFSGHGSQGGFYVYDGLLSYEEIRLLFSICKARNKMIFADACFSGDIREGSLSNSVDLKNNVMLFMSSRGNETSGEAPGHMRNGLFTACLLRSLKGGGDLNRDRIISAKELFLAVSEGVKELSNNRQHPVMWGSFEDTMPVIIW